MQAFNPGDLVGILNEPIHGTVISCTARKCRIRDDHGFEREVRIEFLVHRRDLDQYKLFEVPDKEKIKADQKKVSKPKASPKIKFENLPEIDLHFEALADKSLIIDPNQILQKQLTACRAFVQKAIRKGHKRIVLIHGKGEGILKAEIHLYLNRLESEQGITVTYKDASASEYGAGGATEVNFL